jgi:hypothetical protein
VSIKVSESSLTISVEPNSWLSSGELCLGSISVNTMKSDGSIGEDVGYYLIQNRMTKNAACISAVTVLRKQLFRDHVVEPNREYIVSVDGPGFLDSRRFKGSELLR